MHGLARTQRVGLPASRMHYVPDNPLIVQSDHTLLLETMGPHFRPARDSLVRFAELVKSPDYVHTYRVTPLSLWNAASSGMTVDEVLATLQKWAKYEVPPNVPVSIRQTMGRWGRLQLYADPRGLRLVADEAVLLTDAGVPVLGETTAPPRGWRDVARGRIARFDEVQLLCPPAMAADRERAVRWGLTPCPHGHVKSDVMEVAVDDEPARAPDLTLYTDVLDVPSATTEIVRLAERLAARAALPVTPSSRRLPCVCKT
jgi:hypothetical protein